ncbi:MAG: quinone-dependent dihydroorotate dehydrogenase [Candidatus Komeilibacteria bacterium]|nr:quinone-dependent dihydroorotate dehydrogenase [Candidatus Komeilibacteria bacterium]
MSYIYQKIIKPIFFKFDPEFIHDRVTFLGRILGGCGPCRRVLRSRWAYSDPRLEQNFYGLQFPNPVGLAAGFDKNAQLLDIIPAVGFGFMEVGSITGRPCAGNDKPRLWRLPEAKSLVVNYGLKCDGAAMIADRLRHKKTNIPLALSIAATNCLATAETVASVEDYVYSLRFLQGIGDMRVINISCPNTYGGQPFTSPERLEILLQALDTLHDKPTFIKLSPDVQGSALDNLLNVIANHKVEGIICSNLTKDRGNQKIAGLKVPEKGGLSGKVVEELANRQLAHVYQKTGGKYILIGLGGIFTAADAYKKIKLGANLVQLVTGLIYQGPQVIGEINRDLVKLLTSDGYKHVSEAVGKGI